MTIYITTVRGAAERLATAHANASALAKGIRDALGKAAAFTDPNLSDQGLVAKRQELAQEFRDAARADYNNLAENVAWGRRTLAEHARENVQIPDEPAALIRAQQKWQQVEQRLNAGQDLPTIMRTADEVTARAVAEFAPSWASAQYDRPEGLDGAVRAWLGETPSDASEWIQRAAYRRLAEVARDPNARELFAAETAAERQAKMAQPWLTVSESLVEGRAADFLGAAIASQVAAQSAPSAAAPEAA
ncbi:hypothetical protein [Microbacterium aerolatum]|uniref:hypothetical protein n=1 Tax=Microbacterium aerolatum TaxID=153731 RepID=UPI0038514B05